MSSTDYDPTCDVCKINARELPIEGGVIFENDLWLIRHMPEPYGLPGWMMLHTQRHVPGPADFNDAEAANFGPALRHFQRVQLEVTGALRIYTAGFGESSPHIHIHMAPRYADHPDDALAWGVANLMGGRIPVDPQEVERITVAYREALATNAPPR